MWQRAVRDGWTRQRKSAEGSQRCRVNRPHVTSRIYCDFFGATLKLLQRISFERSILHSGSWRSDRRGERGAGEGAGGCWCCGVRSLSSFHSILSYRIRADYCRAFCSGIVGGITRPVPVVGPVVEGVGKTPIAQKLGGKDEEHKGYLGTAIEYAGEAVRTVYDAAGNVVRNVPSPRFKTACAFQRFRTSCVICVPIHLTYRRSAP